ncbi:MAG: glycosyltransferase [Anaerolineae bacterium]|nr:glycosyltransferase [Anaerolineae bacterium]
MNHTDLTIILPTRDEARNILTFLASIPPDVPLIVVDSSCDETPHLIAEARPHNTAILHRQATVTEARQIGAAEAITDWLLFTDADVRFATDYFYRLRTWNNEGAIYGAKLSSGEYAAYYRWFVWGQGLSHRIGIPAASGSNLLIRRSVFDAVGGFDLSLTCNEDTEIAFRIQREGYQVDFEPDLAVYETDHRRLRRGVIRKTLHSLVRCLLLYFNLLPADWHASDWDYWNGMPDRGAARLREG